MNEILILEALGAVPRTIGEIGKQTNLTNIHVIHAIRKLKKDQSVVETIKDNKKFYTAVKVVPKSEAHVDSAVKDEQLPNDSDSASVRTEPADKKPAGKKKQVLSEDEDRTAKFESIEELTSGVSKSKKPVRVDDNDFTILIAAEYTPVNLANEKKAKADALVENEMSLGGHKPILSYEENGKTYLIPYVQGLDIEEREYVLYKRKPSSKKSDYAHTKNFNRMFTKYLWDGVPVRKGKLVLMLMKKFISENPDITEKQLEEAFPYTMVKSFGLITTYAIAQKGDGKGKQRYFGVVGIAHPWGKKSDQIKLASGKVYCVTNQIDKNNFPAIIDRFIELGTIAGWDALEEAK